MSEESQFELLRASFLARFQKESHAEIDAEVMDLAEVLRCQTLELEKVIKSAHKEALASGYWLDPIGLSQPLYRLKHLYMQITGFGVNELWDKQKEQEG